ncbi:hypothetical protein Baya_7524 [Bagarius yarrelli]|uniref:Uncharacterized protein n=1 Tax=Bagarius yarrelli TaxID=175774 RepID=A0A556U203_BAGYA|nr:hypothetical protein Baya_7524 [Bagarius yarrelli]
MCQGMDEVRRLFVINSFDFTPSFFGILQLRMTHLFILKHDRRDHTKQPYLLKDSRFIISLIPAHLLIFIFFSMAYVHVCFTYLVCCYESGISAIDDTHPCHAYMHMPSGPSCQSTEEEVEEEKNGGILLNFIRSVCKSVLMSESENEF